MVKIETLKPKDISQFANVARSVIGENKYYSLYARSEELKELKKSKISKNIQEGRVYLAAKEKNNIVGFLIGYFDAGTFWIDYVGIANEHRKKGISSMLMNFLEKFVQKEKAHKIWCDTRISNKEAIALFKKLKFKKVGLFRKHWYGQDFYFWEKIL